MTWDQDDNVVIDFKASVEGFTKSLAKLPTALMAERYKRED